MGQTAKRPQIAANSPTSLRDVGPDEVVVYVDEVDIHLNAKIGLDWMLGGQQRRFSPLTRTRNATWPGPCPDARTGKLTWVQGLRKTSSLFLELLYRLATRTYRNARRIHVILDNYGIHDSLQVNLALATEKREGG